jgi:hypothetical protein
VTSPNQIMWLFQYSKYWGDFYLYDRNICWLLRKLWRILCTQLFICWKFAENVINSDANFYSNAIAMHINVNINVCTTHMHTHKSNKSCVSHLFFYFSWNFTFLWKFCKFLLQIQPNLQPISVVWVEGKNS